MTQRISRCLLLSAALSAIFLAACANQPLGGTPEPITLTTATVQIVGKNATIARTGPVEYVGYWTTIDTFVQWPLKDLKPGTYNVEVLYALDPQFPGSIIAVTAAGQSLSHRLEATKNWDDYHPLAMGALKIERPDVAFLAVRVTNKPTTYVMNLQKVILTPSTQP